MYGTNVNPNQLQKGRHFNPKVAFACNYMEFIKSSTSVKQKPSLSDLHLLQSC